MTTPSLPNMYGICFWMTIDQDRRGNIVQSRIRKPTVNYRFLWQVQMASDVKYDVLHDC